MDLFSNRNRANAQLIEDFQETLINTQPLQIGDHPKEQRSSPSRSKMDKKGVHSPKNVEEATVPAKGTASPIYTVAGKDLSNSLMADTLLKSLLSEKTKEVISVYPKPKPEPPDTEYLGGNDYEIEYKPSIEQFTQDPNKDDDSGMSFESIASHNLDT
ncbi:hypothetical protein H5410_014351 [Solanum commersonii]|uniref:Uncharacterized protein n=1 Tax=Solanum commersonii TaxID=4109 RepID=A0A9J5ZR72_SOLCO|nr:hypothetical protein H5410_014351 [Solanum commersonii]